MAMEIMFLVLCLFVPSQALHSRGLPKHGDDYPLPIEVQSQCRSYLSSSIDIQIRDSQWYKNELSFSNGDWSQEKEDDASLMPYCEVSDNVTSLSPPLKFTSFTLTSIGAGRRRSKRMINVAGTLLLGMSRNLQYIDINSPVPTSQIYPGSSLISVSVEGIYFEIENNDGSSRMLCMVGTADFPIRQGAGVGSMGRTHGYCPPPSLTMDDNIFVTLSFPNSFSLTSREVQGLMVSLKEESDPLFFNEVHISSQLVSSSQSYTFGSEELVFKACNPYPYQDKWLMGHVEAYQGPHFCKALQSLIPGNSLDVEPFWKSNITCRDCTKRGPFGSSAELKTGKDTDQDLKIIVQDLKCDTGLGVNYLGSVRVSAVFRAFLASGNQYIAESRTGLNDATLSVEGVWKASNGQLCMVGCLGGHLNSDSNKCGHRVCMYLATTFTITQRSLIFGSISDIRGSSGTYSPLYFNLVLDSFQINGNNGYLNRIQYKYTKIHSALLFLERNKEDDLTPIFMKPLLSYPELEDGVNDLNSLSSLATDLSLTVRTVPAPVDKTGPNNSSEFHFVNFQVVSLNSLFGRRWMAYENDSTDSMSSSSSLSINGTLLLNVSGQLMIDDKSFAKVSGLFLEGVYDPVVGKMYLIGCRNVPFPMDGLEDGLDCKIEVKIEYPPTTSSWLVNPNAKISISSQRNDRDPLHFSAFQLVTDPITYQKQRREILSRRNFEGVLRILTLTFAAACILNQLVYIRKNTDGLPFISLIMLGIQAIGYILPLITGFEEIFAPKPSEANEIPYYIDMNPPSKTIDVITKLLMLASFLLTLRLIQKVWKSRIRLLTRTPLEPHRIPSDKKVLLVTMIIHTIGFLIIFVRYSLSSRMTTDNLGNNSGQVHKWASEGKEYIGLVEDFFLLPQIFSNFLWQTHHAPLTKVYYMGITVVMLLPHMYDIVRPPMPTPFWEKGSAFADPHLDFYSKFGNVAIPAMATVYAGVVYVQQRWGCQTLYNRLSCGQRKLVTARSSVYERLPSRSFEGELVSIKNDEVQQVEVQEK